MNKLNKQDAYKILKKHVPSPYMPFLYAVFALEVKEGVIKGGRSSGKTELMHIIAVFKLLNEPYGDILLLKNYQKQNRTTGFQKMRKWIDIMSRYYPELNDFIFKGDEKETTPLETYRIMPNGAYQHIHYLGLEMGGVGKIKSFFKYGRYCSATLWDESDDPETSYITEEQGQEQQLMWDTITMTVTRLKHETEEMLNLQHNKEMNFPDPFFMRCFNPRTFNSAAHQNIFIPNLLDDEELLEKQGWQLAYNPEFENGNGLVCMTTNYRLIEEESKVNPTISISYKDINKFRWLKDTAYEVYKSDGLGMMMHPFGAIFKDHIHLFRQDLPANLMPIILGIDFGIQDHAAFVLRGRAYEPNEVDGTKVNLDKNKAGSIWEKEIKGFGNHKTTLDQKAKREKSVSYFILKKINEWIEESPLWRQFWKTQYKLLVVGGPKDFHLLNSLKEIIRKDEKYNHLSNYIRFAELTKVYNKWNVEKRHSILRNEILFKEEEYLSKEFTPKVLEYFQTLTTQDMTKKGHPALQNIGDAYFYSLMADLFVRYIR